MRQQIQWARGGADFAGCDAQVSGCRAQAAMTKQMLRDDLDENGGGDLDFEAAAGSGVMIVADLQLCKFFRRRC